MKTRKSYRKFIAILLSIVTIIGCFSVTAFAEENDDTPTRGTLINGIVQVPSHEINFGVGNGGYALQSIPVYYDYTLSGSYQVGTINYHEGFTILADDTNEPSRQCVKVEYNTPYGPQQGYIAPNTYMVMGESGHSLAYVNVSSATVYYGAESGYYQSFGTVYYGEFVVVLGVSSSYNRAFIEYNAANGNRKRGYVNSSTLYYFNNGTSLTTPFDHSNYPELMNYCEVRSGPSSHYPVVGYINDNEPVRVFTETMSGVSGWHYITYKIDGTNNYKAGYVFQ